MNKLPASAGIIMLTSQTVAAVKAIPTVLVLKRPNNCTQTSPRMPTSAIGNVGTIAKTKNNTLVAQAESVYEMFTLNNFSTRMYWTMKTTNLQTESAKILVNSRQ